MLISALLLWRAVERILHPASVVGSVAIAAGLAAATANWGVARLLLLPSRNNAAIRLAYIHNMGDRFMCRLRRLLPGCSQELIWPEKIVCGHADEPQSTA